MIRDNLTGRHGTTKNEVIRIDREVVNKVLNDEGLAGKILRTTNSKVETNLKGVIYHDVNSGEKYVGPSVDGEDKVYVKVLSGDVDRKKPSFA
jgi:hypothetical protein